MLVMADKKPKAASPKAAQTPLRVEDSRLLDALELYAKQQRRSRNMTIQIILEEKMKEAGLWPPKDA